MKHGANVRSAAAELGILTSDLRQLTLVNRALIDAAYEAEELQLDRAEAARVSVVTLPGRGTPPPISFCATPPEPNAGAGSQLRPARPS